MRRATSLIVLVLLVSAFGAQPARAPADREPDLRRRVEELRSKVTAEREQERKKFTEHLGDRLNVLLGFSVAELKFALETKMREKYEGAAVISGDEDPKLLGTITDEFDPDSIFNAFGTFGSEFSDKSVWNRFGRYGDQFGDLSAANALARKPPIIVKQKKVIGRLTTSKIFVDGISANELKPFFTRSRAG